jgi:hydrogenase-4 component B
VLRPLTAVTQELLRGPALPETGLSVLRTLPLLAAGVVALLLTAAALRLRSSKRITRTWACGLPELDSRMQYTSTAFSKPLRKVFARVYKPERSVEVVCANPPYFPESITYRSVRTTSFEKSLYRPVVDTVVAMATRLRRLQTGNVQIYLLYIFLALVALLVFMRFA